MISPSSDPLAIVSIFAVGAIVLAATAIDMIRTFRRGRKPRGAVDTWMARALAAQANRAGQPLKVQADDLRKRTTRPAPPSEKSP